MEKPVAGPTALEEATVKAPLPQNPPGSVNDTRTGFYETFKRVTGQYDPDFVAKRHQELNSMLILAALLSVVTYAAIILIGDDLKRDVEETNNTIRTFVANAWLLNFRNARADPDRPMWNGPNFTIIFIRTCLGLCLASFTFTIAFVVVCKQMLNYYAPATRHGSTVGSTVNHGQDQRRWKDGMATWRIDLVIGCLPIILILPLLILVGVLFSLLSGKVLAGIAVGFTAFSLFTFLIARAIAPPRNQPFQTPPSEK